MENEKEESQSVFVNKYLLRTIRHLVENADKDENKKQLALNLIDELLKGE